MTANLKLSEALRSRSTVCGTCEAPEQAGENALAAAKQQSTLLQDMLSILSRPLVFPYQMGERAGFILAQAVEDRLRLGSSDTDMEMDDATKTVVVSIDAVLSEFLRMVKNQRAGRASGNTWLKLLTTVETHLVVQEGTPENVGTQRRATSGIFTDSFERS